MRPLLGALLLALALASCTSATDGTPTGPTTGRPTAEPAGEKVFDAATVEEGVLKILTERYSVAATDVTCPEDQAVKPGTSFDCGIVVDGANGTVSVTVVDADGTYEVGHPK